MSINPHQSYADSTKAAASPREIEASLLIKAAQKLQAQRDSWKGMTSELSDALTYNRKLWTIFSTSVTEDANPLPREVRENVANLAMFVFKQTLSVQAHPSAERLNPLININRQLASGLHGSTGESQPDRAIA